MPGYHATGCWVFLTLLLFTLSAGIKLAVTLATTVQLMLAAWSSADAEVTDRAHSADCANTVVAGEGKQSRASSKVFSSSSTCYHPLTGEYLGWEEFEAVIVKLVQDTCPVLGEVSCPCRQPVIVLACGNS